MAQPAWKRPGSPIGRTGARKAHPKYKQRAGQPWSSEAFVSFSECRLERR